MKQTIFDDWVTFPFVFLQEDLSSKREVNETQTSVGKEKFNQFRLKPNRVNKLSTVNSLKEKFGIQVGKVKTFTTGNISTKGLTLYNGSQFYLCLVGDKVELRVISGNQFYTGGFWNVGDIVSTMKSKNPEKSINSHLVKDLLLLGKLQVKFDVSISKGKPKDHGTLWKVIH